jgi:glycosyltransferase involved in cell wall biosynthesis
VVRTRAWTAPRVGHLWAAAAQLRMFRRHGPGALDVYHWHNPHVDNDMAPGVQARLKVFTNHTSHFLEWSLGAKDPARAKAAVRNAEVVICPSQELVEATLSTGFPADRVHFVSNGVDTHRFSPEVDGAPVRRTLGIEPDEVVFLCPRRLEKKNGVTYWLRALPEVVRLTEGRARVRFVLVGDYLWEDADSDRAAVVALIDELSLGPALTWLGNVAPPLMPAHVAAADVVVLPSLMEATSISGLEALASGKPLVGTSVGGIPQILRDGETGVLVPPADPPALAAAMARLALDPALRAAYGREAARDARERYSWDAGARRTLEIYADEIRRRGR